MQNDATDPVMLEALEWFVRLRDAQAGDQDRRVFRAWLAADASHAAAWARAEALWSRFDIVQPELGRLKRRGGQASRRRVLLGGALAVVGVGGITAYNRSDLFADFRTGVGERRSFVLSDGSKVELGSYSALSLDFTASLRRVQLHRGQGFFDVAEDAARPFAVAAADGATQALGTRFDVKHVDDLVTVTVNEHAVLVRTGAFSPVRVEAGYQISYDANGPDRPTMVDLSVAGAWRQDRIMFQDVPLRRVLAELERYRPGRIVLTDTAIGATPVTAVFDTAQVDHALQTIAETLPIRLFHATRYLTIVTAAR